MSQLGKRFNTEFKEVDYQTDAAKSIANTIRNQKSTASSAWLTNDKKPVSSLLQNLLVRQKRTRKCEESTNQQKQLQLIAKLTDPNFKRQEQANRKAGNETRCKKILDETKDLIVEMDTAHDQDHQVIARAKRDGKSRQTAMHRFSLLPRCIQLLSNKANQEVFLDNSGCAILEKWLQLNPDGSYPPIQVIEFVLDILSQLPIDLEHLQECEIARALQIYACDKAKMGPEVSSQATHLLQRWQITVYNLSYEYDESGLHELQQRELKRKLEVLTDVKRDQRRFAMDEQEQLELGKISKDDELIRKSAQGNFVMYKSNFDFLEKPMPTAEDSHQLRQQVKKQKTAKGQISAAFNQQKQLALKASSTALL